MSTVQKAGEKNPKNQNVIETIQKRISVRSYSTESIPAPILEELKTFLAEIKKGPFGTAVRFIFLDECLSSAEGQKKLGTYGMITGDRFYIAGAAEKGDYAEIDYGYCLERIILKATGLGLGTCWLGGTLNRKTFEEKISVKPNEIVPAVTPVGIPADQKRLKIILVQNIIQARKRKPFTSLFFDAKEGNPLAKEDIGKWGTVLEAVRDGPSASNKQPWRVIKTGQQFHFCLEFDAVYNMAFKAFSIQKVDMGIALCHFELTARELGLPGGWKILKEKPDTGSLMYCATWEG